MKIGTQKGLPLLLGLIVLILSQLLAACGGSTPSNNPNAPVDLNVWVYPAIPEVAAPPADWELTKVVRQKLNINLKVTLIPTGDDGDAKLNAAAAANDLPDLFQINTSASSNSTFLKWIDLGLVSPVDKLLPMMPQRTKDRYSNATLNKLMTVNGSLYALQEATPLTKRQGLFIRKDWLDKLGLQPPKTLDDLLKVAEAFTTRDPDGNGKNDTYGFGAYTLSSAPTLGGQFDFIYGAYGLPGVWNTSTPGKISLNLRDPNYLKATEFIKKMADEKVIDPDWTTLKLDDYRARWKQGKYGIFVEDFCAAICQANYQPFDTNNPNGQLVPLNPPQGPDGKAYIGTFSQLGFRMGVSKKAMDNGKGPAIAKLMEWLNSGEGYYLAGFGKEGVNYKLDSQGNISTDGLAVPFTAHEVGPSIQIRNMVLNGTTPELKVRYPSFKTKNGRTIDPINVYQTFAAMPSIDVTSNFAIKTAANQGDINRYVDEGLIQFVTGQKPLNDSSWNTFVKGLDGLGVTDWENSAQQSLQEKGLLSK
jgi:putative aldouronate transport system substrate-binding protein